MHFSLRTKLVTAFLVVAGFSLLPALRQVFVAKIAERRLTSITRDEMTKIEELTVAAQGLTSLVSHSLLEGSVSDQKARNKALLTVQSSLAVLDTLDNSMTSSPEFQQIKRDLVQIDQNLRQDRPSREDSDRTRESLERMSSLLQEKTVSAIRRYDENLTAVSFETQQLIAQQHKWTLLIAMLSVLMSWNLATHILRPLRSALKDLEKRDSAGDEGEGINDELTLLNKRHKALVRMVQESNRDSMVAHQALDSMDDAVLLLDRNGFIELANDASVRIFGIARAELENSPLASHPRLRRIHGLISQSTSHARHTIERFEFERLDGTRGFLAIIISGAGQVGLSMNGFVIVARDESELNALERTISAQRQRLEQAERLAAVGTMGAIIAHKFSQPLTSVRMFLQQANRALEDITCPPIVRENLEESLEELNRTSEWVKVILNRARDSSNEVTSMVNIKVAAESARDALSERLIATGGEISLEELGPEGPYISGGQRQIEEIFYSLFNNAIQACGPQTALRVRVALESANDFITVMVSDNCEGIPPEHIDRIFECFFSTKERNQGTGLGLAIVRQILSSLGGDVAVSSEIGKGTVFSLKFPRIQSIQSQGALYGVSD